MLYLFKETLPTQSKPHIIIFSKALILFFNIFFAFFCIITAAPFSLNEMMCNKSSFGRNVNRVGSVRVRIDRIFLSFAININLTNLFQFFQKLNKKKIEISFLIILLCSNKLPKQPTQQIHMAMTNVQLTKMVEALTKRVDELEKKNGIVAETVVEKKDSKKEKKEKKVVDPSKPKKTSGYLIYSSSVRAEVKEKLIADGGEGKPKEVVQAIAAKWKGLGEEEKAVWNEKAKTPPVSDDDDA